MQEELLRAGGREEKICRYAPNGMSRENENYLEQCIKKFWRKSHHPVVGLRRYDGSFPQPPVLLRILFLLLGPSENDNNNNLISMMFFLRILFRAVQHTGFFQVLLGYPKCTGLLITGILNYFQIVAKGSLYFFPSWPCPIIVPTATVREKKSIKQRERFNTSLVVVN